MQKKILSIIMSVTLLFGVFVAPASADVVSGGSDATYTFQDDTQGGNCDDAVFTSLRPTISGTTLVGRFLVKIPKGVTCTFEVAVVQYMPGGGIRYVEGTPRVYTVVGTGKAEIYTSNPSVGCQVTGEGSSHRNYASAIFVDDNVSGRDGFDADNDGVFTDTADGGAFDAYGGSTLGVHLRCVKEDFAV